jgi:hypothetical protein
MASVGQLYTEALELSELDREILIGLLQASLEDVPAFPPGWQEEMERRIRDIDEGREELIDSEEALAAIFPPRTT